MFILLKPNLFVVEHKCANRWVAPRSRRVIRWDPDDAAALRVATPRRIQIPASH
jgi:hypothetical protein